VECLRWTARLPLPERSLDAEFVSLRHPDEYPMNEGRMVSSRGIDAEVGRFEEVFEEFQVPESNALHSRVRGGGPYFLGPLARVNLNLDRLGDGVTSALRDTGVSFPTSNPYWSIVARAVEILYAIDEALRVIDAYEPPAAARRPFEPRAGRAVAVTEAPRGSLFQAYETDAQGIVRVARIVPPTSQNLEQIESDLRSSAAAVLKRPRPEAKRTFETMIRNYDPCISCSTHFLRLEVVRGRRPRAG